MERLKHNCTHCGAIDYVALQYAGPHIKALCAHCGKYIRFVDKSILPDPKELKMKIMVLAKSDINLIQEEKNKLAIFYNGISGMDAKIAYYRLFVAVSKRMEGGK